MDRSHRILRLFTNREDFRAKLMWAFRTECARLEQADNQRKPPSTAQRAEMEFDAVKRIAALLGVEIQEP